MENTHEFKTKLETELKLLEEELSKVGKRDPSNPNDWVPTDGNESIDRADLNEVADSREEYGENRAILTDLEIRYNNVKRALQKIEEGTYGTCEISGEQIEEDRLNANPAARTCKAHMNEEADLPL